jgi:anti-sigma B factor antagonist
MGSMSERPEFSVTVSSHDSEMVVAVHGEIDLHTAPQLDDAVDTALRAHTPGIVIDLSGVKFIDSAACHALVRARNGADHRRIRLVLRGASREARRVLEMTKLDQLFAFTPAEDDPGN